MEEINDFEIDGLVQTLKETGIKGLMKYTDVLVLNHMRERGWISSERDKMIKTLKEETEMSYGDITQLLERYSEWKQYLPSYSLGLNQKLDTINKEMNSVVPFRWIGNGSNRKLIGVVKESNGMKIYDSTGKNLMLVGTIDKNGGILWNDYVKLTTPQQKYIIDEVKHISGILL